MSLFNQVAEIAKKPLEMSDDEFEKLQTKLERVYDKFEELQKQYENQTGKRWIKPIYW